jgi:ParB-like chromosome segregation protein Spo0J
MIALSDLAFQNADVLEALAESPNGLQTLACLASQLGRDKSNLSKTLRRMSAEGLLDENPMAGLTPAGHVQLAAIRRARHGGERRRSRGRWPVDKIVRNPANRIPRAEDVAALADTVEATGDVLQDVQLTPPDANGVRILLAGEHRWLATRLLADQDRLPPTLAEGLPFREREADPGERLLIAIVENTARTDLSPLEDARLLRDLQAATGWSAREIAKKTGRSPQGSETGVRDVQSKIKVAREASAEAIADHEAGRIDWSQLRETVMRPRPQEDPAEAHQADPGPSAVGATPIVSLTRAQALGLAELYEAGDREARRGTFVSDLLSTSLQVLLANSLAEEGPRSGGRVLISVTDSGRDWLRTLGWLPEGRRTIAAVREALGFPPKHGVTGPESWSTHWLRTSAETGRETDADPLVVNGVRHPNMTRANEARRMAGLLPNPSNHSSGGEKPKPTPPAAQPADPATVHPDDDLPWETTPAEDQTDDWGRDHNARVADRAVLTRVTDFVAGVTSGGDDQARRLLFQGVGVSGPFTVDDATNVLADVAGGLQPRPVLTVDVDAEWPPERAQALAALVAWALTRAFGDVAP